MVVMSRLAGESHAERDTPMSGSGGQGGTGDCSHDESKSFEVVLPYSRIEIEGAADETETAITISGDRGRVRGGEGKGRRRGTGVTRQTRTAVTGNGQPRRGSAKRRLKKAWPANEEHVRNWEVRTHRRVGIRLKRVQKLLTVRIGTMGEGGREEREKIKRS